MNSIVDEILKHDKFYELLDNYEVIHEKIGKNNENLQVQAEFITNISKYKFLQKIISKLIDQKLLHLQTDFMFDPQLYQIKFNVKPKLVDYFHCIGTLYCDIDFNILSHNVNIEYSEKFNIVKKLLDEKIKDCILKQIKGDIEEFKKIIKK